MHIDILCCNRRSTTSHRYSWHNKTSTRRSHKYFHCRKSSGCWITLRVRFSAKLACFFNTNTNVIIFSCEPKRNAMVSFQSILKQNRLIYANVQKKQFYCFCKINRQRQCHHRAKAVESMAVDIECRQNSIRHRKCWNWRTQMDHHIHFRHHRWNVSSHRHRYYFR